MGSVSIALHEALSGLSSSFRSVELRVAAYRGVIAQPPSDDWQPLGGLIRISFRDAASLRAGYVELQERVGCDSTPDFALFQEILPFSDLPTVPPTHGFSVRIIDGRPRIEVAPVNSGQLRSYVDRFRQRSQRQSEEGWPMIEYFMVPPTSPPAGSVDVGRLNAEIRREIGVASIDILLRQYLEVSESSTNVGRVFIQLEMPAMISSIKPRGSSVDVEVCAHRTLERLRLFVSKRTRDGIGIEEHLSIPLVDVPSADEFRLLRGTAKLKALVPEDSLEFVLTHTEIPELDDVIRRVRDLLPIAELNPLLVCLRRFWNVNEAFQALERPYSTKARRIDATPQTIFQARVAELLTLAGFQAIDLRSADVIRDPTTKVEIATADTLAYHAKRNVVVVGACTINVPKTEDYEKVLHATSVLEQDFPDGTSVVLIPAIFAGQEADSVLTEQAASRRLKLFTRQELATIRTLIDSGQEDQVLRFLTSPKGRM